MLSGRSHLLDYDEQVGIDWEWLAGDGAMTKAPLGGEKTGPNPTDRARDVIKPWQRSWIFPRDPKFLEKAGRSSISTPVAGKASCCSSATA